MLPLFTLNENKLTFLAISQIDTSPSESQEAIYDDCLIWIILLIFPNSLNKEKSSFIVILFSIGFVIGFTAAYVVN